MEADWGALQRALNRGFFWQRGQGLRLFHAKCYLPNEDYSWEANWFSPGRPEYRTLRAAGLHTGMLTCTEFWFTSHILHLGQQEMPVLAPSGAGGKDTAGKWLAVERTPAVVSRADCLLSSCRDRGGNGLDRGGMDLVTDPGGPAPAKTVKQNRFVTAEIGLRVAKRAK